MAIPVGTISEDLHCGDCQAPMQLRQGPYGLFWGCTRFPTCRGALKARSDGTPAGIPAVAAVRTLRREVIEYMSIWARQEYARVAKQRHFFELTNLYEMVLSQPYRELMKKGQLQHDMIGTMNYQELIALRHYLYGWQYYFED